MISKKPERVARHLHPLVRPATLTEARVLQITNDVSEDMCRASRAELAAVVRYWSRVSSTQANELAALRADILCELFALALKFKSGSNNKLRVEGTES